VSVAETPAHVLLPRAVTVLLTEQASMGELNVAVKFAEAPGARLATVSTVGGVVRSFMTVTLMSVTSPGLLTVPEYVIGLPAETCVAGQFKVTAMRGVPDTEHVADPALVTTSPVHLSVPCAVSVDVIEQSVPAGTV
jgi:hypothetical protein